MPGIKITGIDLENDSCLNGWGFGNLASSANDVAKFHFEYFGSEKIIKYETAAQMIYFSYMKDPNFNVSYGLGVMPGYFGTKTDPNK